MGLGRHGRGPGGRRPSIHHEAVTGLGKRPPKYATSAMNILMFGSDTRAGLSRREQLVLHVGRTGCGC